MRLEVLRCLAGGRWWWGEGEGAYRRVTDDTPRDSLDRGEPLSGRLSRLATKAS